MNFTWTDDHSLVLNFGNSFRLSSVDTRSGGPGYAVTQHEHAARRFAPKELSIREGAGYRAGPAKTSPETHPITAFAWGWWGKGWESHEGLWAAIDDYLLSHATFGAYLYSPKEPEMYRVRILATHWARGADYVGVPVGWKSACPDYYNQNPALCRAFFLVEAGAGDLVPVKPDDEFGKLVVSPVTFAEIPDDLPPGGELPHDSARKFFEMQSMSSPERASLRATEKTLWVVQRTLPVGAWVDSLVQSVQGAEDLTRLDVASGAEIPARQRRAALDEVRVLGGSVAWARLKDLPRTMSALFALKGNDHDPLFRADVELVSRWVALSQQSPQFGERTDAVNSLLIDWALETDYEKKLRLAQHVYQETWYAFCERYRVPDASSLDKYVGHLTDFEKIFAVTKHGLAGSMYRDHLNHNVRSALLVPRVLELLEPDDGSGLAASPVGFFAGLLHDIAYVVSESEDMLSRIRMAIDALTVCSAGGTGATRLNKAVLKSALLYVLVLSSTPKIHDSAVADVSPWRIAEASGNAVDPNVFRDVSVAAGAGAHSLLGAVALFALAAGIKEGQDESQMEAAFSGLFERLQNPGTELLEVLQLVQSVALHDRKEAAKYAGLLDQRSEIPATISFGDFPLAVALIIADELQDWGRPVGAPHGHIFSDFEVADNGKDGLFAAYSMSAVDEFYEGTPYSLFEHVIGKLIAASRVTTGTDLPVSQITIRTRGALRCEFLHPPRRKAVVDEVTYWLEGTLDSAGIRSGAEAPKTKMVDTDMIAVLRVANQPSKDLLYFRDVSGMLHSGEWEVDSVVFEKNAVRLVSAAGVLKLTGLTYVRGSAGQALSVAGIGEGDAFSLLMASEDEFVVAKLESLPTDAVEMAIASAPSPHFLDLDWRFAPYSARKVVELLSQNVEGFRDGASRVCYLGCPTLAVAHAQMLASSTSTDSVGLRDIGHQGIARWIARGYLPASWFERYDVGDKVHATDSHKYDVVVMDPPWYEEHYSLFLRRARDLLKESGGLIGIAQYPGYGHRKGATGKRSKKKRMVELEEYYLRDARPVFALTVYYAIPRFEATIRESLEFRLGSGYRPTKMVFYEFDSNRTRPRARPARINGYRLDDLLVEDTVFKVRADVAMPEGPGLRWPVEVGLYDSLRRPESDFLSHVVAWSSDNVVLVEGHLEHEGYTKVSVAELDSDHDLSSQLSHVRGTVEAFRDRDSELDL